MSKTLGHWCRSVCRSVSQTLRHWSQSVLDFYGGAKMSNGHFGTSAEMSWVRSVLGPKCLYTNVQRDYQAKLIYSDVEDVPPVQEAMFLPTDVLDFWCTDTSDLRHFGPKTFRHCVWCRSVTFLRWCQCRSVSDSSALKCMWHFGPRIKIGLCFECVKNVDPLYICYSSGMEVLGKRLTKVVSD